MKLMIGLWLLASALNAAPVVRDIDWHPACDGASIEIVTEKGKILSVTASATHFAMIRQWTLHYLDGHPLSAEFREYQRGRIVEGDEAGKPSGINPLKRLLTFSAEKGRFTIPDETLQEELTGILMIIANK